MSQAHKFASKVTPVEAAGAMDAKSSVHRS
jgi:hypothetical protein